MGYIVERKPDVFEEVGATTMRINDGALVFYDEGNDLVVAYAQGQWITVVPEAE